ncbi:FMN-linked oxidoreductase [Fomitiporia mediterranea MF3/22]|uniref:FMN-linked oxidoreductase n=1 Tax=Fomitiporia mediterranea (strain MF3/22) TaxID=694068 RepID=UPI00044088C4|nr:FMN-linked oxidoreductase [Fomitiporia mediterranea MF3/22]EJC99585.1 FMN-linked oxidoreductase [Fomitiporia mediterranea MF3/22]
MAAFSHLLSPVTIGSVPLRNRLVMSALTRDRSAPTNVPNDLNVEYYKQRAEGGAGLIVTEGTLISQQGTEWPNAPGIWSKEHVSAWKKVTDAVHSQGGKIFCQLWHLGRVSHPDAPEQKASGLPVYAPSAVAARGGKFRYLPGTPGYVTPTEVPDPTILIEQYKNAAVNAKEAGFDGVELHAANGYLVQQFLDNTINFREDKWGGSTENRCRFGLEVLKVLVDVWGADKVGVKLNPCGGYNDAGMTLEETIETYSHFIKESNAIGLAYVCLARYAAKMDVEFDGKKRATRHDVLATYSPLFTQSKLLLNADVSPQEADQLISENKIDGAVLGWLWISNPDLAHRLESGKEPNYNVDIHTLYGASAGPKGYTDYPFAA